MRKGCIYKITNILNIEYNSPKSPRHPKKDENVR